MCLYLHFAADSMRLLSSLKTRVVQGRSRSSKIIDFGTNQKRVIVTLVLSCTVSKILQVFVLLTPPLFHPNFGGIPVAPDRPCWGQCEQEPMLFHREIIFEEFRPMLSRYLNVTEGRTTDRRRTVA